MRFSVLLVLPLSLSACGERRPAIVLVDSGATDLYLGVAVDLGGDDGSIDAPAQIDSEVYVDAKMRLRETQDANIHIDFAADPPPTSTSRNLPHVWPLAAINAHC